MQAPVVVFCYAGREVTPACAFRSAMPCLVRTFLSRQQTADRDGTSRLMSKNGHLNGIRDAKLTPYPQKCKRFINFVPSDAIDWICADCGFKNLSIGERQLPDGSPAVQIHKFHSHIRVPKCIYMKLKYFIIPLLFLSVCPLAQAKVKRYNVKVVAEYKHDDKAYTQGLFFYDGSLYESTGLHGSSSLRRVELESGKVLESRKLARKYFGEGSVALDGKIYLLTWQNNVAFIYDADSLRYEKAYSYPRDGWGLTTDGKQLIASDGSSSIYFLSPEFQLSKTLKVTLDGRPLRLLNELEWIDGKIWANVYTTDMIVVINPSDGKVESIIDCTGLLPDSLRSQDTDVLNGIAVNEDGRIFITGKNWPRLYEITLTEAR